MEKHDEWAAPINSSGLVRPAGSFARDAHVTSKPPSPDDWSSTRPEPSMSDPCQVVVAERLVAIAETSLSLRGLSLRGLSLRGLCSRVRSSVSGAPGPPYVSRGDAAPSCAPFVGMSPSGGR